jgi:hypothetical protein
MVGPCDSSGTNSRAATIARIVTEMTAIPAPCGVGTRCDDLAFGRASAYRIKSGRSAVASAEVARAATITITGAATNQLISTSRSTGAGSRAQMHPAIELDDLTGDELIPESLLGMSPGGSSEACTPGGRSGQLLDRCGERRNIVDRHEDAGPIVEDDRPTSRNIGCDHRTSRCGGFEQDLGEPLTARGKCSDVDL